MKLSCLLPVALLVFAAPAASAQGSFERALSLQGVQFQVSSANQGSLNTLRIASSGRIRGPRAIEQDVEGLVVGAEAADLDGDGWPEVYVYVQSAGSGSYGSVVAYAVDRGISLSAIAMPDLADDPTASAGYMGHDRFALMDGRLERRFPIYRRSDPNVSPSGGTRHLRYRLVPGGAGLMLQLVPGETQERR